jgi:Cthe_2314-like HEPN
MKTWSFEELRDLCQKRGISNGSISNFSTFATSLDWRYLRAKFHAEQAHNIWKDLMAQSFTFGDEKYNEAEFSYEAYVEACVQSLHSMGDILGQIINILILAGYFTEDEVSIKKVARYMSTTDLAPDVLIELNNLINSIEFSYIEAFCNTIKHRRLIKTEYRIEYGGNYRNEEGLIFVEFDYKSMTIPKTWAKDIIEKYREEIFKIIVEVGLKVNDFFK